MITVNLTKKKPPAITGGKKESFLSTLEE